MRLRRCSRLLFLSTRGSLSPCKSTVRKRTRKLVYKRQQRISCLRLLPRLFPWPQQDAVTRRILFRPLNPYNQLWRAVANHRREWDSKINLRIASKLLVISISFYISLFRTHQFHNLQNPGGLSRSGKPYSNFEIEQMLYIGNLLLHLKREV